MTERYKINIKTLPASESFKEAGKDELRVLLALLSTEGKVASLEGLKNIASVSTPRLKSALTFWEESGVIERLGGEPGFATVINDFDSSTVNEAEEITSKELAVTIRNEGLAEFINELTGMMGEAALNHRARVYITSLISELGLSPEYILTLAAYLKEREKKGKKLTPYNLQKEARQLDGKGITTLEELEIYINENSKDRGYEWEIRRKLGLNRRALTDEEVKSFARWVNEYGYSVIIIKEAYDQVINWCNEYSLDKMNIKLSNWHSAGCKTVEECRTYEEEDKQRNIEKKRSRQQESAPRAKKRADEAEVPKYAAFDTEDALMRALERSYGDKKDD